MNTLLLQSIMFMSSAHMNTMPRIHKIHYPKMRKKRLLKGISPYFTNKDMRRKHMIKQPGFDVQRRMK